MWEKTEQLTSDYCVKIIVSIGCNKLKLSDHKGKGGVVIEEVGIPDRRESMVHISRDKRGITWEIWSLHVWDLQFEGVSLWRDDFRGQAATLHNLMVWSLDSILRLMKNHWRSWTGEWEFTLWTIDESKAIPLVGWHTTEVTAGIQERGDAAPNICSSSHILSLSSF